MFEQFTDLVSQASGWAYAVIFAFALLDAILPVVPSETAVITGGVVAAADGLSLALLIPVAAAGACAGDNIAYFIGRRFGARVRDRFFSGDKARERIDWAKDRLDERGGELIAVARFIPGGRTAVTLTAGLTRYPWPRFLFFDVIASALWGSYGALVGYFGGKAFENQAWKGLLLALGIAFAITGLIELVRWAMRRRHARTGEPDPSPGSDLAVQPAIDEVARDRQVPGDGA